MYIGHYILNNMYLSLFTFHYKHVKRREYFEVTKLAFCSCFDELWWKLIPKVEPITFSTISSGLAS